VLYFGEGQAHLLAKKRVSARIPRSLIEKYCGEIVPISGASLLHKDEICGKIVRGKK